MSITKVSDGKYRIFVSAGTRLDGSRKRYSKTVETNLKGRDLDRFLRQTELDFETEILDNPITYNDMANNTFSNFVKWWLGYVKLTDQTKETYKYNLDYIETYIGKKILSEIKQSDILELLDIIKAKKNKNTGGPISERTIRNYLNVLKSVFSTAKELEIIRKNPAENVKYTVDDYQIEDNYYDIDDINEMIFALDNEPIEYQLAILLTLSTGVRIGELIAFEEDDFNRVEHHVRISKAVSEIKGEGRTVAKTKNKKTRIEYYPAELEDLLDKHLEVEALKKKQLGVENKLIFTGINGSFISKKTIPDWFRRFLIRNKLKRITFHGLRHTSATILLANGIPLKNVAERLGHSRASTTANIYAHAIPRIDKDAANVFSGILSTGSRSGSRDEKLKIIK